MPSIAAAQTGRIAIELAGAPPVFVGTASLPIRSFPPASAPSVGTFEASVNISEAGTLLEWVMSLARHKVVESAGSLLVTNLNLDRQRRFDWPAAALTELVLSTLDVSESKKHFAATFKWQPSKVTTTKDSGKLQGTPARKKKAWMCSNFRLKLSGLPGVESKIVKVELPTVTGKPAGRTGASRRAYALVVTLGPLRLTVSAAGIDAARDWVQTLVSQGGVLPADLQTISIEIRDAALARTLGTITVEGCQLQAWEEAPLKAASTTLRTAVLTFSVQGLDLRAAA
jgi:hypothetical protein